MLGAAHLAVAIVGIADRAYRADGTLVPRTAPGAVIDDPDEIARRTVRMVTDGVIRTVDGTDLPVECDTVLVHGDTAGAIALARRIRDELTRAGVVIAALTEVLAARAGAGWRHG
ncbi:MULTISPECIES: LamB/YcsF family protein [Amycolatopsis]|uniref:LamB/YcsF family protein n=1 Tax=Amycolatopsis TaxID=1813 RepID=UPI0033AEA622